MSEYFVSWLVDFLAFVCSALAARLLLRRLAARRLNSSPPSPSLQAAHSSASLLHPERPLARPQLTHLDSTLN